MNNDVQRDVGKPNQNKQAEPSIFMNWFAFIIEGVGIISIPATAGWKRASRAYCEERRQWLLHESVGLVPGHGMRVDQALAEGSFNGMIPSLVFSSDQQSMAKLLIEYVVPSDGGSPIAYPIYLSISDPACAASLLQRAVGTNPRYQFRLEPDQILDLLPLFPKLKEMLSSKHDDIRQLIEVEETEQVEAAIASTLASDLASVHPVAEAYRNQLRNASYKWIVNAIGLSPLVFLAAGLGSISLGAWLLAWFEQAVPKSNAIPGIGAIIAGIGSFAWGIYLGIYCLSVPENRWISRRLRSQISMRPGGSEMADDPEALFVSMIPRESWLKIQMTMASDLLLLKLDPKEQELRMCGDTDNYVIPLDSIAKICLLRRICV